MADEAKTEDKTPKRGVGTVAVESICAGMTNEAALEAVKAEFPDAKTSLASINWYRNKLRTDEVQGTDGKPIPTARGLKKAAKAEAGEDAGDEASEDPLD